MSHSVSKHKVDRSFLQYMISGNWVSLAGNGFHLLALGLVGISAYFWEGVSFVAIATRGN